MSGSQFTPSPRSEHYVPYVRDRTGVSCRRRGYSDSTTKHYLYWIRRFMQACEISGPRVLRAENAQAFLNTLTGYAHATRKQARALHFLFNTVLMGPLDDGAALPRGRELLLALGGHGTGENAPHSVGSVNAQ